jgi:glucose-6-phosphate 1-dehydrogenase
METQKPVLLVIFGVTGDLAQRKLLPALFHLIKADLLPKNSQIIGVTRQNLRKDEVLACLDRYTATGAPSSLRAAQKLEQCFHLLSIDMSSGSDYKQLKQTLDAIETKHQLTYQRLYYLSIPPSIFGDVVTLLGMHGLQNAHDAHGPLPSLLIEKPFGYDLVSAKALIKGTRRYFKESQIYRIDHYLAKEMAQNILDFRFSNPLFEGVWNNQHIKKITITAFEAIGIEKRAAFYEQTGALRDLVQSHLLQLLSLVTMRRPAKLDSSAAVHAARMKLLDAVVIPRADSISSVALRGQYKGYKNEVNNRKSQIETYASLTLSINTPEWQGTTFVLQTGKALSHKTTHIDITFEKNGLENVLRLQLQPNEGIYLDLQVKVPGHKRKLRTMQMDFSYQRTFPGVTSPEAYERVLLDAFRQDQTLFASSLEVLTTWRIVEPVLHEWSKSAKDMISYKVGARPPLSVAKV